MSLIDNSVLAGLPGSFGRRSLVAPACIARLPGILPTTQSGATASAPEERLAAAPPEENGTLPEQVGLGAALVRREANQADAAAEPSTGAKVRAPANWWQDLMPSGGPHGHAAPGPPARPQPIRK